MADTTWRRRALIGTVVLALTPGCGDSDVDTATVPPPPLSASTTMLAPTSTVIEAVVVAFGQSVSEPRFGHPGEPQWWLVLDLQNGVMIEGSSRVLVEMVDEEVGCDDRSMLPFQLKRGERVSFELVAGEPGPPPEYWMSHVVSSTFPVEPAVRGQRFEADVCADRTPPIATDPYVMPATTEG